jgi:DNA polymerase-3 subunit delta'
MEGEAGAAGRREILERLRALSLTDIAPLFTAGEELAADREGAADRLEVLASLLRDVLLIQGGRGDVVNRDLLPLLEDEAGRLTREKTIERIGQVMEARQAILRNANPRLTMDVLLMRLAG